jgi:hypothetical protein
METTRFDAITSTFAQRHGRRGALRLLGLAAFGAGSLTLLGHESGQSRNKKKGGRKGGKGKGRPSSGTPSTPGSGGGTPSTPSTPSRPADMCPVSAKVNAPVCGTDPDGECHCHRAAEGNNFCGGQVNTCAGLRSCTSTADCRESVGFHFVCQAADGGACGQVCVPACENRDPYP